MGEQEVEEDEEIEKIRREKLKAMMQEKENAPQSSVADTPVEVTDLNFDAVVKKGGVVVVDCWAAWCAPCRMIAPIIDELAKDYAGKLVFGKLNVDENRKVALEHQIMSIPTLLVFKNGELVDRIVGVKPRKILEPMITRHL